MYRVFQFINNRWISVGSFLYVMHAEEKRNEVKKQGFLTRIEFVQDTTIKPDRDVA